MSTLAIDVGGTKFSVAVFEGKQMLERESHSTDREGGRASMLPKIEAVIETLATRHRWLLGHGLLGVYLSCFQSGWHSFVHCFYEGVSLVESSIDSCSHSAPL